MDQKIKEIQEYLTEDGKTPFSNWLKKLKDITARARIRIRLDRLRLGNMGNCRGVGGGVLELKIDYGPGYRIYFGLDGDTIIILLIGGTKQRQSSDVKQAKEYWLDYKRRKNE